MNTPPCNKDQYNTKIITLLLCDPNEGCPTSAGDIYKKQYNSCSNKKQVFYYFLTLSLDSRSYCSFLFYLPCTLMSRDTIYKIHFSNINEQFYVNKLIKAEAESFLESFFLDYPNND